MGRRTKQLKNYTTEQLESLFASDSDYQTGLKIHAIIQLCKGYSSRKLSEFYGVSFKQICNWADRFDAEGLLGLGMKPGRGRHSFLTEKQKERLRFDFQNRPADFGYADANWSVHTVCEHVKRNCGVEYKQAAIYNLMRQLGVKVR